MRKFLIALALLCGAASAYATAPTKWCSGGFGAPAMLVNNDDGSFALKIGKKTEILRYGGSIGTGINGFLLVGNSNDPEQFLSAQVTSTVDPNDPQTDSIRLFRDRVFWPCP